MSTDVANPLIAARQDSTGWYSGIGVVEGIADIRSGLESGSWIETTIGGVGTSLEALAFCVDPLGAAVSWGVAWLIEHVKPLSDALDWLAGDPDQITAYAQTWQNVSKHVGGQVKALSEAVRSELAGWAGPASDAYRRYTEKHLRSLTDLADSTHLIGMVVEGAGLLVALVRELVRDLIADFVSVLAVRLWEWLAEAGLTLGIASPWVAAQVSSLVAKWVAKVAELLTALARSVNRLRPILSKLGELLDTLRATLKNLRRTPDGAAAPDMPAPGPGPTNYTDTAGTAGQPPPWSWSGGTPPVAPVLRAPSAPSGGAGAADDAFWPPDVDRYDPPWSSGAPSPGGVVDNSSVWGSPSRPDPHDLDPFGPADPGPDLGTGSHGNAADGSWPADDASAGHDRTDGPGQQPDTAEPRTFHNKEEAAAYGARTWGDVADQVTPDQKQALDWYRYHKWATEGPWPPDFRDINGALRGEQPMTPEMSEVVARMDEALDLRPVPEGVMVSRDVDFNAFDRLPDDGLLGSTQHDPAFLSTSLGPDVSHSNGQRQAVLHLEVPAGTPGMYVDVLGPPREQELLLGRGQSYVVDRIEQGTPLRVYGRIIPGGGV